MTGVRRTKKLKLVLYFQVHQPRRLKHFDFFAIGNGESYFDDDINQSILHRVAYNAYLPTNKLLLRLIKQYPQLKITFSISGVALDQLEAWAPEVLESFRQLAATGSVEFLAETHYHSLASQFSKEEFEWQVKKHAEKIQKHFGIDQKVFRNTELIYSDEIGNITYQMGYRGIFLDHVEHFMHGRSPHYLYKHPQSALKLFIRNYKLSDDISFRFSERTWKDWPLTAKKYINWLEQIPHDEELLNFAMDYETFGEHQKKETGIFLFLEELLEAVAHHKQIRMVTPSEAITSLHVNDILKVNSPISWADTARDLSAWLGNDIQQDSCRIVMQLEKDLKAINDPELLSTWRYLQGSDHFYYMSTKKSGDGEVHAYFSPYNSPYEAYINYMNVLTDFLLRIKQKKKALKHSKKNKHPHLPNGQLLKSSELKG